MQKQTGFSLRVESEKFKIFSALCTLNDTTPTNVLRDAVDSYIEKHKDKINVEALD